MASPFTSMLRRKQKCVAPICIYRRCFASKRKRDDKKRVTEQVRVKSLFESQTGNETPEVDRTVSTSYRALLDHRHDQASRSVLVRTPVSPQGVCDALQALGAIKKAYILQNVKSYLLVEFKHKGTVDKFLQHVSYFPGDCQVAVRSRLTYAMQAFLVQRHSPGNSITPELVQTKELTTEDYIYSKDISSQMQALHSVQRLSDVGSRLRFFMCSLVEDLVRSSLPFCHIEPFGSSSNGFGWDGCDLDMMMSLGPPAALTNQSSKFRFLTKRGSEDERVFGQQCLDVVGEMIRAFMPLAYGVNKVLNARVPIVKFHHEAASLDCDLSYVNLSGTKMSELMYLLGEIDPRVRVLMSTIKQWAKSCDLTRSHPGPWPANFTLLAMLIFFLQTRSPPVLPTLRHLQDLAGPNDHFIIDDVDYAFVTDVSKVRKSENTQSLEELLKEFFHFYVHMDFSSIGLSLIEGSTFPKQTSCPLHIENPMDIGHNVSNNVSAAFVTRLQEAMVEALQCLESKSTPCQDKPWGLLCLFQPSSSSQSTLSYSVADLFESEEGDAEGEEVDSDHGEGGKLEEEKQRELDTR